jgi:hypothetical protein
VKIGKSLTSLTSLTKPARQLRAFFAIDSRLIHKANWSDTSWSKLNFFNDHAILLAGGRMSFRNQGNKGATKLHGTSTEMADDRKPHTGRKSRLLTLSHIDGRTRAMSKVRSLAQSMETDLGGADRLTSGQRQLVQRAAVLGALIEDTEARWATGEAIEVGDYLAAINAQRRVLATLGLKRVPRDVTPSLAEYIATHRPEAEAE